MTKISMDKRVKRFALERMLMVGDMFEAREAQRMGIADFVGTDQDVENEIARLIFRNCQPNVGLFFEDADVANALQMQDDREDFDDEVMSLFPGREDRGAP